MWAHLALLQDEGRQGDEPQFAGNQGHVLMETFRNRKAVRLAASWERGGLQNCSALWLRLATVLIKDRNPDRIEQADIS